MNRRLLTLLLLCLLTLTGSAQRRTDRLDRGLVAVRPAGSAWRGTFLSWRVLPEEYYDVTYNVYCNGVKLNSEPLSESCYLDKSTTGTADYSHEFTVRAVVNGVEQEPSKAVTALRTEYVEITPNHDDKESDYWPNDATAADVDGDGELELIVKMVNRTDAEASYPDAGQKGYYDLIECYKLDGRRLWWINVGPNMTDFQSNEINIAAYDWDGDGRAECVMRAADGTTIHMADGTTQVIGDASYNSRVSELLRNGSFTFTHSGAEFLLYLDGQTAKPYQVMTYPLRRLEPGETSVEAAWGDGYGHRSSKHFFGAPYLDGRKPSIFLARGIYTRHKFIALDVDPVTHQLTERWRWQCNDRNSPWYGNGYHNYTIADVDWDGRDEIVFGSMTIDDNGRGLSTSGLGHGDAHHVGDLDPYRHGQEFFGCLEEGVAQFGNNLRDATTSEPLYKYNGTRDDGRCIMGNFSNDYPGCIGSSSTDPNVVSAVKHSTVRALEGTSGMSQNFRIYWDDDLLEETFNGTEVRNSEGSINKYGKGSIKVLSGSLTNNDTKSTPCLQADLFGDWREEVVMRTDDGKIRIFTTTTATTHRLPTLWSDKQYRNAVISQMNGYNQPPHLSYFIGELEGITYAPPVNTTLGRIVIANGATLSGQSSDHLLMCETSDMTVAVSDGAAPAILTVDAPSWIQGTDVDGTTTAGNPHGRCCPEMIRTYFTHTLTGGAFGGKMRLVKTGDGILQLPAVTEQHSGETNIWAGTLRFDGTLANSPLWLNRFARLEGNGTYSKGIEALYAAEILPGGPEAKGTVSVAGTMKLGFGARLIVDLYGSDLTADCVKAEELVVETKSETKWKQYGPKYLAPVVQIVAHKADGSDQLKAGRYLICEYTTLKGSLSSIVVEGLTSQKCRLVSENNKIYVEVEELRQPADMAWRGGQNDNAWDFASTQNFRDASNKADVFVNGDNVVFDDKATSAMVNIVGEVHPSTITFNNAKLTYTIAGDGSIVGDDVKIVKKGTGVVNINNVNSFTGTVTVNGGSLLARTLPTNDNGLKEGAFGSVNNPIILANGGAIGVNETSGFSHQITLGEGGGALDVVDTKVFTVEKPILSSNAAPLYKRGLGTIILPAGNTFGKVYLEKGRIEAATDGEPCFNDSVVIGNSGTLVFRHFQEYTVPEEQQGQVEAVIPQMENATRFYVPKGNNGTIYLDGHCDFTGEMAGEGTITLYTADTLNVLRGDWSQFVGVVDLHKVGSDAYGRLPLGQGFCLDGATLRISEQNTVTSDVAEGITLGAIDGTGRLEGIRFRIGAAGTDFAFSGNIAAEVEKVGSGRWTVPNAKPLSEVRAVTVSGGELMLTSNFSMTTAFFGQAPVAVHDGGTLAGNGIVGSITLHPGAQLTPGAATSKVGSMTAASAFIAEQGSVINLSVSNGNNVLRSRSFIVSNGDMTLNGTIRLLLSANYSPKVGDKVTLWTCAGTFSGHPQVELPELPAGLAWDTEHLQSDGLLTIVEGEVGIDGIATDRVRSTVYSVSGIRQTDLHRGANIIVDERGARKVIK